MIDPMVSPEKSGPGFVPKMLSKKPELPPVIAGTEEPTTVGIWIRSSTPSVNIAVVAANADDDEFRMNVLPAVALLTSNITVQDGFRLKQSEPDEPMAIRNDTICVTGSCAKGTTVVVRDPKSAASAQLVPNVRRETIR